MDYPLFSFPNLDIESKTRRQALSSSWRPDIALVATPPPHWCGPSLQAKPCSNLPEVLKPSEDPGRALKRLLATWSLTDVGQIPGFLLAAVVVIKKLDQKVWQQRVKGGTADCPPPQLQIAATQASRRPYQPPHLLSDRLSEPTKEACSCSRPPLC